MGMPEPPFNMFSLQRLTCEAASTTSQGPNVIRWYRLLGIINLGGEFCYFFHCVLVDRQMVTWSELRNLVAVLRVPTVTLLLKLL